MSFQAQQTILERTPLSRENDLLLAVARLRIGAAQLALDSVAPTEVPCMTGCGGRRDTEIGVAHPRSAFVAGAGSQRQDRECRCFCCPVALASWATSLQQRRFHRAPFLPYFPCFPSVTRFGAYPAPGGNCATCFFGFQKSFQQISAQNADEKIFRTFRKCVAWPWERGTLASLRARVSRGNFGQIQTGEKQWHSTKTKSR